MTDSTTSPALVGSTFRGYRLEAVLARGSTATIYRATHGWLGHPVALKMFRPEMAANDAFVRQSMRAAKTGHAISHPNVTRTLDAFWDENPRVVALVYELLQGVWLSSVLSGARRLNVVQTAQVVLQIAEALTALHGRGIVVGTLDERHVCITGNLDTDLSVIPSVKIVIGAASSNGANERGDRAPEVAAGGPRSTSSDIFALGSLLTELCDSEPSASGAPSSGGGDGIAALRALARTCTAADPASRPIASEICTAVVAIIERLTEHPITRHYDEVEEQAHEARVGVRSHSAEEPDHHAGATPEPKPRGMSAGKITSLVLATAACASLWTGYALDARRFTKTIGGLFAPIDEPDEASAAPVVNRPAAPTVATSSAATTTSSVSHAQLLSSPPGAIVVDLGDGHELGRTPLEVSLPIRTARAFEVRLIGFTPQKLTLAAPGAPVTVSLDRIGGAQNLGVQSAALTTQAKDKSDVLSAAAEDILTRTGGGDKVGLERMRATQAGLREELLGLGLTLPDLRSTAPDALNRWNRWLAAVETPTFDELNTTKTELTDAAKRMTITKPLLLQKLERGRAMLDRVSVSERDETHRMTSERVEAMVVEVTRAPTVDATTARAVSRLELDCFQLRSRTR